MQFYFTLTERDDLPDAVADIHDDLVTLGKMSEDLATQCKKLGREIDAAKMRNVDYHISAALQILEEFF